MVLKGMTPELYNSLSAFRNRQVGELVEPPVVAEAGSPVSKILGLLIEKNVYDVFIPFASNKVANINIRDILSVRDITSAKPSVIGKIIPTLTPESSIGYAARILSYYRLRALPVVQNSEVTGQITAKKIVGAIQETGIEGIKAANIMTPDPVVMRPADKASAAKGIMIRHRIDHIPVVDERRLAGIVTSVHIAEAMLPSEKIGRKILGVADQRRRLDFPVSGIADREVVTSGAGDSLRAVTGSMIDANSTYSVVRVGEEVQGIITYRDIVALLGEKIEEEIPAFIIGLPDDPFEAELAKSKFSGLVKFMRNMAPEIEEARCRMKLRDIEGERRRYEVDVSIITPYRRHVYTATGWDLAKLFDEMSDGLKKKFAHRRLRKQRESVRYKTERP
jgi:CBS domain-containing protein